MDLLEKLEKALEGMVEGVFTRAFKAPLQPIEVAKRLSREMENHRSISVSATYVPNSYTVHLSPEMYQSFQDISAQLLSELEQYLRDFTSEHQYQIIGQIAVKLAKDDNLHGNEFQISAVSESGIIPPTSAILRPAQPQIQTSTRMPDTTSLPSERTTVLPTSLNVMSGEDSGRQVPLTVGLTIGRGPDNALVLNEPGISRHHAEVVRIENQWVIRDLESTNGTFVNTRRITSQVLRLGDSIKIGATILVVR